MTTLHSIGIATAAKAAAAAAKLARMAASKAEIYTQLNICLVAAGHKTVEFKRLQAAPLCTEAQLVAHLQQQGYTLQGGYYVAKDKGHAIIASRGLVAACYRDNAGRWVQNNDVFNHYLILRLRAKVAKNPVPVPVPVPAPVPVVRTIAVCDNKINEFLREVAANTAPAIAAPVAAAKTKTLRAIDKLVTAAKLALQAGKAILCTLKNGDSIITDDARVYHVSAGITLPIFADGVAVRDTRGLIRYLTGMGA